MHNNIYVLSGCLLALMMGTAAAETGTVAANLDIHVPALNYESLSGTQNIWADFEYLGTNPQGRHLWGLKNFGVNVGAVPQESTTVKWLGKTLSEASGWKAKINVNCLEKDKTCGSIDFRGLNCSGSLTYVGVKYERHVFAENLEYGSCVKSCEVHIDADGTAYKEFCGARFAGEGKLSFN